ncbi:tetratricopeptide repeat protein 37 [Harmonia axyridis]|uniref:tetratricopeptide repeat protein 37 n=1 Tax=Harmonia axyridis TaxID=115357 RepID=UPI001E278E4F|nr:tetratricopeptide repeat protein 37 [Harmonia axyridis]
MDIKSHLKEAREAIKNRDFRKSIKLCRDVLDEDKDNYIALVFLGLSIQETDPSEESEKAFRRAIEINPENLLAWNGLANYFEKIDTTEARLELIKIYTFLIGKETTEKKLIDYCEKLCSLYKYTNVEEICKVIYKKVENGNYSESALTNSRSSLATILKQSNELSDDILEVYEDILSSLVSSNETATVDYYSQYLTVLYKQKKYEKLLTHVIKMYKMFPEDVITMKWICQLYNELYVENKPCVISEYVNIDKVHKKLSALEPESVMGIFTKAICDVNAEEHSGAKDKLLKVVSRKADLLHAWILLTRVNIMLHSYNDAAESAKVSKKLMQSPKYSCEQNTRREVEIMHLEALSRSSESSHWEKAVELYEKLDEKSKDLCLPHYTRANIKLGNMVEAKRSITKLEQTKPSESAHSGILLAQLMRKENHHNYALEVLEKKPIQTSEYFLELGVTYFEIEKFDECLLAFLKAAKSDANNYYCFYYLGRCYCEMKQYDKARRCYERSYKLCPSFSNAAIELSKIYRLLKNWDSNAALLKTITKDVINKGNTWAWLQMGLNSMEQGDYDRAIQYLRLVSRVDEDNGHCWEALADAYLYKGAYTSALKAYERVLEISVDALYPALQIALIKKDLGHFHEAMLDFEALLCKNRKCILTLTGLAETCLKKAAECIQEQRLGTARDCAQYGVEAVSRAIKQGSEISALWKILGDCCILVAKLPEKYCCLMIMRAIDEPNHYDGDKILEKEDLLQLAVRCYSKAIVLTKSNDLLWHDLAVAYFLQAKHSEDKELANEISTKAQAILQQCSSKNPTYWQHWNLLGIILMTKDHPNYAFAQHCFIKAVTVNRNCAVAWTNLGVLYLKLENILLANQAFGQAQRSDPNYIQSWIGQGILAEVLDQGDEAMDLFRHSTDLGFHPQGALGYGHWVCRKLMQSPMASSFDAIDKLHAVPVACDALTWYTQLNPYECCSWNMLGILKERMGLLAGAAEAFRKALNMSSERYSDFARINFGRVLNRLGHYKEAIKICSDVQESSFNSGIWYALALYKDNQFQEASSIYLAIVQYLAKELTIGDVVACMAIITYGLGEPDLARKAIVESFNKRLPTARVMYALIALGVLQKDSPLIPLTLKQVEVLEDVPKSIENFISLLSYIHIFQGNHAKAVRKTSELVHLLPGNSDLWLTLSITILYSIKQMKSPPSHKEAAKNAANVALKLRDLKTTHKTVSKILCTISASSLLISDYKSSLISAQKAIFCTPNAKESWVVFNDSLGYFTDKQKYFEMSNQVLHSSCDDFNHIRVNTIF